MRTSSCGNLGSEEELTKDLANGASLALMDRDTEGLAHSTVGRGKHSQEDTQWKIMEMGLAKLPCLVTLSSFPLFHSWVSSVKRQSVINSGM